MKLSTVALLSAALTSANGAVVTVTQHVHANAVVSVEGRVYVENGQTYTTFKTLGQPSATSQPSATASPVAAVSSASAPASSAGAYVTVSAVANDEVADDASTYTTSYSSESATSTAFSAASPSQDTTTTLAPSPSPATTASPATTSSTSTSTSATSSPSSSSTSGLSSFASSILDEHNKKRALHQDTPALSWSDTLATYAQNYADNYDCSGTLTHSGGPYGENLALGYDAAGSVDAWYGEISQYSYSNPTFSSSTGHFTQVVWKSSTELGCGIKTCGGSWGSYVICSYNPPGNYLGEFSENVEPLA